MIKHVLIIALCLLTLAGIIRAVVREAYASQAVKEENKCTSGFLATLSMSGSIYRFCDTELSIVCYERSAIVSCVKY